jgi:acetyl esterase/lipase
LYKVTPEGRLYLHIFNPTEEQLTKNGPGIVFFHGGGWTNGNPKQFYPQCTLLSQQGYVCISAEYRIKSIHGTTPIESVEDSKSAIRYMRENSSLLKFNPGKIIAIGGSAGGHIAAAAGTLLKYENHSEDTSISSRPNYIILLNPVIDNSIHGFGYRVVRKYWRDISPLHNISEKTPETLILSGDNDRLVPINTLKEFQHQMNSFGVECNLYIFEGERHGFYNHSKFNEVISIISDYVSRIATK